MLPQGYKNMDLESQDPIFNANLGQDENLIWTKKLRCSHSIRLAMNKTTGINMLGKSVQCAWSTMKAFAFEHDWLGSIKS